MCGCRPLHLWFGFLSVYTAKRQAFSNSQNHSLSEIQFDPPKSPLSKRDFLHDASKEIVFCVIYLSTKLVRFGLWEYANPITGLAWWTTKPK